MPSVTKETALSGWAIAARAREAVAEDPILTHKAPFLNMPVFYALVAGSLFLWLVFAFLIAPPATASLFVNRVPLMMIAAVTIGAASSVIGILISYHHATATGATRGRTVLDFLRTAITRLRIVFHDLAF